MHLEDTKATFTFTGMQMKAVAVEVLDEHRTLRLKNGSFSDTFKGNEVHLYRIPE